MENHNIKYNFDLNIVIIGKIKDKEFSKYVIQSENIYEIYTDKEESPIIFQEHPIIKSWKFFFLLSEEVEDLKVIKALKLIKNDFKNTNSLLLIVLDAIFNQNVLDDIIKKIEENSSIKTMPFIYLLSKDRFEYPENKKLRNYISLHSKLDKMNFYCDEYPYTKNNLNEEEKRIQSNILENITTLLIKVTSYYNELGDSFLIPFPLENQKVNLNYNTKIYGRHINLLFCGKSGVGKSTFINLLIKEKRVKIGGNGLSTTKNIVEYIIPNTAISIFDTPGFEDEETVNLTINHIKNYKDVFYKFGKQIHLIIYFLKGNDNTLFQKIDYKFIKFLFSLNIHIMFIETHSNIEKEKMEREFNDEVEKVKNALLIILNNMKTNYNFDNFNNHFFTVNLVKNSNNSIFGISDFFNSIHNYFLMISNENLQTIKNIPLETKQKEVFKIIKNDCFLKLYYDYNNYLKKLSNEKNSIILKYIFLCGCTGLTPVPFMDLPMFDKIKNNLLLELSKLYGFNEIIDKNKFNYTPFIGETGKGVLGIIGFLTFPIYFCSYLFINGIGLSGLIYKIGNDYSKLLLKKIEDKDNITFIKSSAEDYLQAIQDFKDFGKYFDKIEKGINIDENSDYDDNEDDDNI
jgi:GTP-binding protein EngB required for normal cell division